MSSRYYQSLTEPKRMISPSLLPGQDPIDNTYKSFRLESNYQQQDYEYQTNIEIMNNNSKFIDEVFRNYYMVDPSKHYVVADILLNFVNNRKSDENVGFLYSQIYSNMDIDNLIVDEIIREINKVNRNYQISSISPPEFAVLLKKRAIEGCDVNLTFPYVNVIDMFRILNDMNFEIYENITSFKQWKYQDFFRNYTYLEKEIEIYNETHNETDNDYMLSQDNKIKLCNDLNNAVNYLTATVKSYLIDYVNDQIVNNPKLVAYINRNADSFPMIEGTRIEENASIPYNEFDVLQLKRLADLIDNYNKMGTAGSVMESLKYYTGI